MRRPDGVTLIAIWHFISAIFSLLGVCGTLVGLVAVLSSPGPQEDTVVAAVAILVGTVALLVLLAAFVIVGWGLWKLKSWARIAAIVLAILQLPVFPIGTVIGALILWYLITDPDAKAAFGVAEA